MLTTTSSPERAVGLINKWFWIFAVAIAAVAAFILVLGVPRFVAVYQLYWSQGNIQRLFYEDLGLSQAWSSLIAVVGSFFYALAWVPLTLWTFRVLVWRFSARQLIVAFACWVFVYGHVPLLHALLGADACFNQRTGAPMKWFVQDADGRIVLFDSAGFDIVTRVEKRPVTPDICSSFARQKANNRPRKITADVRQVEFFDSTTGRPRVWYSRVSDGNFELFDLRGYHPNSSEVLLPMTKEVVDEIMKRLADEEATRKRTEEERRRAEVEAEATRKRAEQERIRVEAEARKQAEQERMRAQAEAQKRAEQERIRVEAEARKQAAEVDFRRRIQQVKLSVVQFDANLNMYSVQVAFALENRTGLPIWLGLIRDSTFAGNCPLINITGVQSLSVPEVERMRLNPAASNSLHYVPENGRLVVSGANYSFVVAQCRFPAGSEIRTSLVVATGKDVLILPASAKIQN